MKQSFTHLTILILALSFYACDSTDGRRINSKNALLKQFKSCSAIDKARTVKSQSIVAVDSKVGAPMAGAEGDQANQVSGETNLQVDGVDELDTTKADGNFIYRLETDSDTGKTYLYVLQRAPTISADVVQKINLGSDEPRGIFLNDYKAIVFMNHSSSTMLTRIISYNRNGNGSLTKTTERSVEGYLRDARMVDSFAHLVLDKYIGSIIEDVSGGGLPIDEVLPSIYKNGSKVKTAGCTDIWREDAIEEPDNYGYGMLDNLTGVLTFDINQDNSTPTGEWIAGSYSSIVYASTENLFLASYGWSESTPIHQFKLGTSTSNTQYIGTALVEGFPINQFAMDEYDGYFRIAVTDAWQQSEADCSGDVCSVSVATAAESEPQANSLYTYKLGTGNPALAGSLRGMGTTEQIYAVRFVNERAFVVTFHQTDPLFAIDLSDQDNPVLKGELKIPGFSNYLHPISDGYLLGIGQSADNTGSVNGMALSIFDVRNLADPKLVQKIKIGSSGTSSEAQYDHHAFRYIPDTHQLVIPVEVLNSNYESTFTGFQIYDVSIANGFDLLGQSAFSNSYNAYQSRAFYKDGIISMIGDSKMVLRDSGTPTVNIATVNLN